MIRPEFVNQHGPKRHLAFSGSDEILYKGSLVVELFGFQRRKPEIGYPKAIAVIRDVEQHSVIFGGQYAHQAPNGDKSTCSLPPANGVGEFGRPKTLLSTDLLPAYSCTQLFPVSDLHFDYISAPKFLRHS